MNIFKIWKKHGFEILVGISILIIAIAALFRIGKQGTWSSSYTYTSQNTPEQSKRPPVTSRGEVECRRVLESIFNRSFAKIRPDFLRNPVTGGQCNLEIDCYNPELRLGVEYNGRQHYAYVPYFHKNKEAFYNQKYRDEMKRTKCREAGITLIEVPYTVKVEDIEDYLRRSLRMAGMLH